MFDKSQDHQRTGWKTRRHSEGARGPEMERRGCHPDSGIPSTGFLFQCGPPWVDQTPLFQSSSYRERVVGKLVSFPLVDSVFAWFAELQTSIARPWPGRESAVAGASPIIRSDHLEFEKFFVVVSQTRVTSTHLGITFLTRVKADEWSRSFSDRKTSREGDFGGMTAIPIAVQSQSFILMS